MQKLEGTIKKTFLIPKAIVEAVKKIHPRGMNRFIRDAMVEKCKRDGIKYEQDDQK